MSDNWVDYSEAQSQVYREGAGVSPVDESDENPRAIFNVRGSNAPRMPEALDIPAGVRERMEGYGETQMKEGFAEFLAYDESEDTWYLPEEMETYMEAELEGRKASEIAREDELFETVFTDYVMAAMSEESPFAYDPKIKTYESGKPVAPPGSEQVIQEREGGWETGVITEEGEGGADSLEYVTALPVKIPDSASIYDGEAFSTGDIRSEEGEWNTREENGDWIWLDRMVARLGTDADWNWEGKPGELYQSGEVIAEGSNEEVIQQIRDRQGLKNGATVKAEAFGLGELLEDSGE